MTYFLHLSILVAIYGILVTAATAAYYRGGLMSLMHAGLFGLGAYAPAVLVPAFGWTWLEAILSGAVAAAVCATTFHLVTFRLKEDVRIIASLGAQLLLSSFFLNIGEIAGGTAERVGIPPPGWLGASSWRWAATAWLLCLGTLLLWAWFRATGWGLAAAAAGQPAWAASIGVRARCLRAAVLACSGALAAVAGSLFVGYSRNIEPASFAYPESFGVLAMVLAGQMFGRSSPLIGAAIFLLVPEMLRHLNFSGPHAAQALNVFFGLAIVGAILRGRSRKLQWEVQS